MMNIYFPDEEVTDNDLYFLCYMIERVARRLHRENRYVVNMIGAENWKHLISVANVLHARNPLDVEDQWIEDYELTGGDYDVTAVDPMLTDTVPYPTQIGKVYTRLILGTLDARETYVDGLIRVYNHELCRVIDNYNASAYYEPSYVIERAYRNGGF